MSTATMNNNSSSSGVTASNDMKSILAQYWWLIALRGVLGVMFGLLALILPFATILALVLLLWPGLTVFAFVLLIAAWSIVTGCLMLAAAVRTDDGRWWLMLGGAAVTAFGILMILAPLAGAVVLTWWLGAFALVFGVALIILAFKLRSRFNDRPGATAARPVA